MVSPDQNHLLFAPPPPAPSTGPPPPPPHPSSRLPTALNNNKTASHPHLPTGPAAPGGNNSNSSSNNNNPPPFLFTYSRKSIFSRSSHTLPPLEKVPTPRTRKGRTVPSSRNNSSKLSRLEVKSGSNLGKRSRSASEEMALEMDAKELLGRSNQQQQQQVVVSHHQTVRVLRARSALLLPISLAPPHPAPLQLHPLILKSGREEERKKRR